MKKIKKVCAISLTFFCIIFAISYAESSPNLTNAKCTNPNGCYSEVEECNKKCGCDRIYKIDEATGECTLDYDYLKERTKATNEMDTERMSERNDRIFTGILYCALFILICACICVISVCIFCCKIHYKRFEVSSEGVDDDVHPKCCSKLARRALRKKKHVRTRNMIERCNGVLKTRWRWLLAYSDKKLKNEVKALADKMNVDFNARKSMKKQPRDPKEESCNVIVEDANIMCV